MWHVSKRWAGQQHVRLMLTEGPLRNFASYVWHFKPELNRKGKPLNPAGTLGTLWWLERWR